MMFGVLLLTVARIQLNINAAMFQNAFSVRTQTNAVQMARQIEYDLLKAGNKIAGRKIWYCDTNKFVFVGSINNVTNQRDSVEYYMGTTSEATFSMNPRDFPLKRKISGGTPLEQQWGLVRFGFWYYDSNNVRISTPFSDATNCNNVRAIKVFFRVEANEPVISEVDTLYSSVTWEKLLVPRNLNNLYY
jgi:hypothetical protein